MKKLEFNVYFDGMYQVDVLINDEEVFRSELKQLCEEKDRIDFWEIKNANFKSIEKIEIGESYESDLFEVPNTDEFNEILESELNVDEHQIKDWGSKLISFYD